VFCVPRPITSVVSTGAAALFLVVLGPALDGGGLNAGHHGPEAIGRRP
jgi:hypothetical protein